MPKFPDIEVCLSDVDANGFAIHGAVRSKLPAEVQAEFTADALSGTYDHLLNTALRWVKIS